MFMGLALIYLMEYIQTVRLQSQINDHLFSDTTLSAQINILAAMMQRSTSQYFFAAAGVALLSYAVYIIYAAPVDLTANLLAKSNAMFCFLGAVPLFYIERQIRITRLEKILKTPYPVVTDSTESTLLSNPDHP